MSEEGKGGDIFRSEHKLRCGARRKYISPLPNLAFFFIFFLCATNAFSEKGVQVTQLSTGQKLIVAEDKSLPVSTIYAVGRFGYVSDSPEHEGLSSLAGNMLLRGTSTRAREEIRDELDQLGADIDVSVGAEGIQIFGQTLTRNLDKFLDIFQDVILHPKFDTKELEKEKRETIAGLKEMRENDQALAKYFFKRALFEGHPYSFNSDGREATLKKITREKVLSYYKAYFLRDHFFFAASGDIQAEKISEKLSRYFKEMPSGKSAVFRYPPLKSWKGKKIFLVDKPARTQTQILIGHHGIDIHHPKFFPVMVANNAFGGGFTSRLMQEVRVKRGWSYGAYSWFSPGKAPGEFAMWVFPAEKDTIETLKLVLSLYKEYAKKGLTKEEFERSKSNLINEFSFKIDTARKRIGQWVTIELMGLPSDYLETYQSNIRKVTLEEANSTIHALSDPANLQITVVCTASHLKKRLKELGDNLHIKVKKYTED